MHAKFQRNRPSNYRVIVIVIKLTPLRFARGTCMSSYPHTSTIVQCQKGGMELHRKKKTAGQSIQRVSEIKASQKLYRPGRALILRFFHYIENMSLCSLVAHNRRSYLCKFKGSGDKPRAWSWIYAHDPSGSSLHIISETIYPDVSACHLVKPNWKCQYVSTQMTKPLKQLL